MRKENENGQMEVKVSERRCLIIFLFLKLLVLTCFPNFFLCVQLLKLNTQFTKFVLFGPPVREFMKVPKEELLVSKLNVPD